MATNTVGSLLDLFRSELSPVHGTSEARAMARSVFQEAFGWDMMELDARRSMELSGSELLKVSRPLDRLRAGEPLQYVLGHTWFMGMRLTVGPGALIPRPETEELVDLIHRNGRRPRRVVDVGTGSGCIALGLERVFPEAEVLGLDVSEKALAIARRNGEALGSSVDWRLFDALASDVTLPGSFDLVVSNPPYVPRSEGNELERHVLDHEPHLALFVDDTDPLLFYEAIARKAYPALQRGGQLWFEGHHRHSREVGVMLSAFGYEHVAVLQDISGSDRFIRAER